MFKHCARVSTEAESKGMFPKELFPDRKIQTNLKIRKTILFIAVGMSYRLTTFVVSILMMSLGLLYPNIGIATFLIALIGPQKQF